MKKKNNENLKKQETDAHLLNFDNNNLDVQVNVNLSPNFSERKTILNASHLNTPGYVNGAPFFCNNTCAFDSIFGSLVDIFRQNIFFKNYVLKLSSQNFVFKILLSYINSNFNEHLFYQKRTEILHEIKTSRIVGTDINCDCSAFDTFDAIFEGNFIKKTQICCNISSCLDIDTYLTTSETSLTSQSFEQCINLALTNFGEKICESCSVGKLRVLPEINVLLPIYL